MRVEDISYHAQALEQSLVKIKKLLNDKLKNKRKNKTEGITERPDF